MRRPFNRQRSLQLDWAIYRMESTRGWRRRWWRLVKWAIELSI